MIRILNELKTAVKLLTVLTMATILITCDNRKNEKRYMQELLYRKEAFGDFDGDGKIETATVREVRKGDLQNNPFGNPWEFIIEFSNSRISSLTFSDPTSHYQLINEGSLNDIPGDELTVLIQSEARRKHVYLQSYTFSNGYWSKAMKNVTSTYDLPDSLRLGGIIFKENEEVYYYEYVYDIVEMIDGKEYVSNTFNLTGKRPGFYKTRAELYKEDELDPIENEPDR